MTAGGNVFDFVPRHWHEKAFREAGRRDTVWFRNRPGRTWRGRRQIPHELQHGDGEGHNLVLVYLNYAEGRFERIPLNGHVELPDNDAFLGALWFYIQTKKRPGEMLDISAETHLLLLQMTDQLHGVPA
jgi:hypothetical protein